MKTHRLVLTGLMLSALACGGDMATTVGRKAARVVPALEKVDENLAMDDVPCGDSIKTPPPSGCAIAHITCGDTVEGNNENGPNNWGDDFYQKVMCTPQRNDYELSNEAIWALDMPPNVEAVLRLESPCADLDLVSVGWPDTSTCPKLENYTRIRECEMDTHPGGGTVKMTTVDRAQTYLVGVDGKGGDHGNFRITVTCRTYR